MKENIPLNEDKYRMLFEATDEGVLFFDTSGRILEANQRALSILGVKTEEIIGKNFIELLPKFKADVKATVEAFQSLLGRKKGGIYDWRFINRKGKEIIVRAHHAPLKKDNEVVGLSIIFDDISYLKQEQEKLRESEERYRMIFDSVNEIIVQIDKRGILVDVNKKVSDIAGYEPEEFLNRPINALTPIFTPLSVAKMIANFTKRMLGFEVKPYEVEAISKDKKTTIFFEITAVPFTNPKGEKLGELGILHDITERKKHEIELKAAADEAREAAEREKRRAVELEVAYRELKKTQQMLIQAEKMSAIGQLASGVAHEVKNPLGIIIQGVNLLERIGEGWGKEAKDALVMIRDAVFRADRIIREMLDFARPTALDFKRTRIKEVIQRAIELVEKQFSYLNITVNFVDTTENVELMIDKNQMEQVFVNILLNAFQATPNGGKIEIKTRITRVDQLEENINLKFSTFLIRDEIFVCEIDDNGVGVPKEKITKVFDPFYTSKSPGEGVGLGLSITRTIIDGHRGAIGIKSQEGKGTKIMVALPLKEGGRR